VKITNKNTIASGLIKYVWFGVWRAYGKHTEGPERKRGVKRNTSNLI